jgi:xanthine/uracil permease
MAMAPRVRKFTLAAHLTVSVGWIGTVVAYLALGVAAATSQDAETVRAAWISMELTGWYVIVPLAVASLVTGLVMALGTTWGLFRHYWVLLSFALTVIAMVVLVLHMPDVSVLADVARAAEDPNREGLGGDLLHPGIGLVVLLVVQFLNVYKPPGMTRYGWRKQQERRAVR